jgi:sterol desaturase/sphingolipid hydroxylase (fatty acid hydroxylase superfamily)
MELAMFLLKAIGIAFLLILNWRTPKAIAIGCRLLFISTPERHLQHHQNAQLAYGDIFTFFHAPAIAKRI